MPLAQNNEMKIIIYALGFKAFKAISDLEVNLINQIDLLVIAKDKSIEYDYSRELEEFAIKNGIAYTFKKQESKNFSALYHIAIGWRWLIKVNDLEQLLIIHDSLLPKYRGFNPLVTALINGDKEVGATLLFGAESYDKGNIVFQSKVQLHYPIKIDNAIRLISDIYSILLNDLLINICESRSLPSHAQNESIVSYSLWRDEEDYFINWNEDSAYIKRFIDSVGFPYKGASCFYEKKLIRIQEASIVPDLNISNRVAGKAIMKEDNSPIIVCGSGLIRIDKAKYENGEKVIFKNFRIRLKNDPL